MDDADDFERFLLRPINDRVGVDAPEPQRFIGHVFAGVPDVWEFGQPAHRPPQFGPNLLRG